MINTVELQRVPLVPWRNGGGVTAELLSWPSPSDWQFRISVARIDNDGPFSAYPNVERWFAVVQGAGVTLRFPARELRLTAGSEALRFDGANPPDCQLLDGPTLDLNLMVRHEAGQGQLHVAANDEAWQSEASVRAVFTIETAQLSIDGVDIADLAAGTLAWSAAATGERWRLTSTKPVRAWWLQVANKVTDRFPHFVGEAE